MQVKLATGLAALALLSGCGAHGSAASAACRAAGLESGVSLQGAAGVALGGYYVTNLSHASCTLGGRPRLELIRADGRPVKLQVLSATRRETPDTRPVQVLRPGRRAVVWIWWPAYCGSLANRPFVFRLTLTTGTKVSATLAGGTPAKCYPSGRNHPGPGEAGLALSAFSAPVR